MIIRFITICTLISLVQTQLYSQERMQPVIKEGQYYYDENDNHEHINLAKAVLFLGKKLLSPTAWYTGAMSYFKPSDTLASDPIELLKPTQTIPAASCIEPTVTWVGHATFLIQMNGFNVLTDPVFGNVMVGPFTLSKRTIPVGVLPEHMPTIDGIVISHDHSDHTDTQTLMWLAKRDNPTIYVPVGNKALFESMGFTKVIENTWWQTNELQKGDKTINIACLPARHWSIRFSLDSYRKSLWASWMIHTDNTYIYFAGDTAYGKHFAQIKDAYPSIDVALMPIAPTEQKENKHAHVHVDAPEAVQAFIDLGARCFIPMHYGTFFMCKASLDWPLKRLAESWQTHADGLAEKTLLHARCGQSYCLAKNSA